MQNEKEPTAVGLSNSSEGDRPRCSKTPPLEHTRQSGSREAANQCKTKRSQQQVGLSNCKSGNMASVLLNPSPGQPGNRDSGRQPNKASYCNNQGKQKQLAEEKGLSAPATPPLVWARQSGPGRPANWCKLHARQGQGCNDGGKQVLPKSSTLPLAMPGNQGLGKNT